VLDPARGGLDEALCRETRARGDVRDLTAKGSKLNGLDRRFNEERASRADLRC
jgi:hypothetical protein